MQASKNVFIRDVIGRSSVVFSIPVYQRNYSWLTAHTVHLLNDIEAILESGATRCHFLGSIVVLLEPTQAFSVQRFILIDGQQRVTTFMLLLLAVSEAYPELRERIWEDYLHNKHVDSPEDRVKLQPLNDDAIQFRALLNHQPDLLKDSSLMMRNFKECKRYLERWRSRYDSGDIWKALHMIEVVSITLEMGVDDPQEIFESINSTGLPLSKSDLIRNFLLMGEPEQKRLYHEYWVPIEQRIAAIADRNALDQFFFVYLQSHSVEVINKERLYQHFITHCRHVGCSGAASKEGLLQELRRAVEVYASFFIPPSHYSPRVQHLLLCLRSLEQATIYPFLYLVFKDFQAQIIDAHTLERTLELLLAYLIRRMVCGVPSNSLKAFFCGLYGRVFRIEENKHRYCEAINKFLFSLSSRDRFPSEAEFLAQLEKVDLYHNNRICRLILAELENGAGKEQVRMDNMTIEHIMPQKLNAEWAHISAEDHGTYLHTLGNLTITGMNAELSNNSFVKKKAILLESKATLLNRDVIDKQVWSIADIRQRAGRLAHLVNARFSVQPVHDPDIIFEPSGTLTLETPELATGSQILSYIFRGEEYACANYYVLIRELIYRLDKEQPDMLPELVLRAGDKGIKGIKVTYQYGSEGLWYPMAVRDNVYVDIHGSAATVLRKIRYLFTQYQVSLNQLLIRVRKKNQEGAESAQELSPIKKFQMDFWKASYESAERDVDFMKVFTHEKPRPHHWSVLRPGRTKCHLAFLVYPTRGCVGCEFYIKGNMELYAQLKSRHEQLVQELGEQLHWYAGSRDGRVVAYLEGEVSAKAEEWEKYFRWMRATALRFIEVFSRYI